MTNINPRAADTSRQDAFATIVAEDLRAVEHGLDDVLARAGAMLQNMSEGRRSAGLAAGVGHSALISVGAMITGVIATRGEAVRAHGRLARTADGLGMQWTVSGPLETKTGDDTKETTRPTGHLAAAD